MVVYRFRDWCSYNWCHLWTIILLIRLSWDQGSAFLCLWWAWIVFWSLPALQEEYVSDWVVLALHILLTGLVSNALLNNLASFKGQLSRDGNELTQV